MTAPVGERRGSGTGTKAGQGRLSVLGRVRLGPLAVPRLPGRAGDGQAPDGGGAPARRRRVAWHGGAVAAALALWGLALPRVDLEGISDYGLVTALPLPFYAALAVLTVSFCVAVARRDTAPWLLALHAAALVVVVHATLPLLYDAPRYAYLYKHLGVVEYVAEHHAVDTRIDIYHNWPGFFVVAAAFAEVLGLTGSVAWAAWAQPLFGLACVGALLVAFRALSGDRRLVWLAVWFFLAANWVGQDYFSPQGFSYVLYLVVLGVCLTWLRGAPVAQRRREDGAVVPGEMPAGRWPGWARAARVRAARAWARVDAGYRWAVNASLAGRPEPVRVSAGRQALAGGAVLALFALVVTSHQLTPFTLLGGMAALAAFRWVRPWFLPVLMLALVAAWGWHTLPYIAPELAAVVSGETGDDVTASLADLSGASAGRATVAWASRALTVAVAAMAALGVARRLRAGHWDLPAVLLALTPVALLVEPYGGEILMRAFFFALPWLAFLAAGWFFPRPDAGATWRKVAALLVASGMLLSGLLFAYFGLERANHVRPGEVAAARWFYAHAEPGSLLMLVAPNFPTRLEAGYHRYPGFEYDVSLLQSPRFAGGLDGGDVEAVVRELAGWRTTAYLMFSTSQAGYAELMGLAEPGALEELEAAAVASDRFEVVYGNEDATLVRLVPAAVTPAAGTAG